MGVSIPGDPTEAIMQDPILFTDPNGCCIDCRTGRIVAVFAPHEEASREEREETAKRREYASQEATRIIRRAA